jgi:VIT1/CCC1 family predicted Fe2+/Mn2+ transporter
MNPGHGAPNVSAPAACRRARSRPNAAAEAGVAELGGSQLRTRAWSSQPRTSGIGTAPGAASQFRPRASASTGLLGLVFVVGLVVLGLLVLGVVVSLAKTSRPSVRVAR